MRRRLSSLTPEQLALIEEAANECHVPSWKLVAWITDDAFYVFEAHEMRRIDEYVDKVTNGAAARRVFDGIMGGMQISQTKPRGKA